MAMSLKFMKIMFISLMFILRLGQARIPIRDQTITIEQRYRRWMAEQGRISLNGAAEDEHFEIFKKNAEFVDKINSEEKPFKLALNKWADITNEDFKARLGYKPYNASEISGRRRSPLIRTIQSDEVQEVPVSVDWRKGGAVTPVKEQGVCGSCWAFSAVAVIESMIKIKQGVLMELSEQNLLDCDVTPINRGCDGGNVARAFEFIIQNHGITSENEYPYLGFNKGGTCRKIEEFKVKANIHDYVVVPTNDEKELMKAVAKNPISVGVDSTCDAFRLYSAGILTENCGNNIDHWITLVGYGEDKGNKYWIAKNSWGTGWGEDGYIRMSRESGIPGGLCGLAIEASYTL